MDKSTTHGLHRKWPRERKHSILLDKESVNAIKNFSLSLPKDESNFIKITKDLYS